MIAKYKAEGGIKNLAWVTQYVEKSQDQEINDTLVKKGYFFGAEILTMNGFQSNQFDAKTEKKILEGLLEDCYKTFGIDPNTTEDLKIENKALPQLTKYYYQKASQSSLDRNILEGSMELKLDLQSANLNKAMGIASSSANPSVKIENPKYLDMKQELGIAQSMKTSLEKILNSTEAMHKDLEAENKKETKDMLKQMTPVFKEVGTFLDTVRKLLAECKSLDATTDAKDLEKKITDLKAACNAGAHHVDGMKSLAKRLRAVQ